MIALASKKNAQSLFPPQEEVLERGLLDSGFNCVLQMPTSSGKTWLAEHAIQKTLKQNLRAIYLAPLRALATELANRWQNKYPKHKIGVFTGDYSSEKKTYSIPFRDAKLLIMTPEKLDGCTRFWQNHWSWIPEVDLIVVDELHLLGDFHRGARLEGAISRMQRLNPFLRILGLSATMGNRQELSEWLNGVDYCSNWRPIPLNWKFIKFKKATEKQVLLLQEISRNLNQGGKSLVFVQSRRKAEEISLFLNSNNINTSHHHAGLEHTKRRKIEQCFLNNKIDVLVATSTLEMGLNLPVRQVILYDIQRFDGMEFKPLAINNVWQRVGRAGRFGLDKEGEAILLIPAWENNLESYDKGVFEPILSALSFNTSLSEQIIAEVSSRMSRTKDQIVNTFNQSLAAKQQSMPNVKKVVKEMLASEMLIEVQDENSNTSKLVLKTTRLGRIASRHFLMPATILLFKKVLTDFEQLTFFDLLLVCVCSPDFESSLPCDYEEIEGFSFNLTQTPSFLLSLSREKIVSLLKVDGKRLLAGIKTALASIEWCHQGEVEVVSENFNCYSFEIMKLRENLVRLLTAMAAIVEKPFESNDELDINSTITEKTRLLKAMVDGGLDEYAATLTLLNGIGPKLANSLKKTGFNDLLELAKLNLQKEVKVTGISWKRLRALSKEARKLSLSVLAYDFFDVNHKKDESHPPLQVTVDPYRLQRATELQVKGTEGGLFYVTGGMEPHLVKTIKGKLFCDCLDFQKRNEKFECKHIFAVRLAQGDRHLKKELERLKDESSNKSLNLFDLWFTEQSFKLGRN